jgi:hypothetical protein
LESRIRKEVEEETTAQVVRSDYRFVVENHFTVDGHSIQTLEHYLEVVIDRDDVQSREPHLEQVWLSAGTFAASDVRPAVVKEAVLGPDWRSLRHLRTPGSLGLS